VPPGTGPARSIQVFGYDGTERFSVAGSRGVWSSTGWLAAAGGRTTVVDERGTRVGRVAGSAVAWTPDGRRLLLATSGNALETTAPDRIGGLLRLPGDFSGQPPVFIGADEVVVVDTHGIARAISLSRGRSRRYTRPIFLGARSRDGRWAYPVYDARGPGPFAIPVYVTDTHGAHPRRIARFPWDGADDDGVTVGWAGGHVLITTHVGCKGDDIYAVAATGGHARRLVHGRDDLEAPAASPDGTRIALLHGTACGKGTPVTVETVTAAGTHPRELQQAPTTDDGDFDEAPSWTPDGSRVVFWHDTYNTRQIDSAPADGGPASLIAQIDDRGNPVDPQPTGGARIAYASGGTIWMLAPQGGAPIRIAADPSRSDSPGCGSGGDIAFSPDGTMLAIPRGGGIWTLRLGASPHWHLAIHVRCAGDPAFSPGGTQIAFDAPHPGRRTYQTDILVAGADGSHVRTVAAAPFRRSVHPTWLAG
jgi:hypothetical protein